jgi:hypothetical protein
MEAKIMDETKTKICNRCIELLNFNNENPSSFRDGLFKGATLIAAMVLTKEELYELTKKVEEIENHNTIQ